MLKEVGVNYDKHKRLLAALKDIKKTFEDIPAEKESLVSGCRRWLLEIC